MKKIYFFVLITILLYGLPIASTSVFAAPKAKQNKEAFILTLSSFDYVEANSSMIYLKWVTAEEIDVQQMELQAGTDSNSFITMEVQSATNTTVSHTYYSALINADQYSYYRLAIVNENGKIEYSQVIHIAPIAAPKQDVSIYPNPSIDMAVNIKVPTTQPVTINIYTKEGRLLASASFQGASQYSVRLPSSLMHNDYFNVQVVGNGKTQAFSVFNK